MIITTTAMPEGHHVKEYKRPLVGEVFLRANVVLDLFASITDVDDGLSGWYESKLPNASEENMSQLEEKPRALGANTAVGGDLDSEKVGQSILMYRSMALRS